MNSPLRSSGSGAVLAFYAALLLGFSLLFPWWRMENRAPQYGMRVLVVEVSPLGVQGDTKEIDVLGHYVGIRSVESFAAVERTVAPFAIGLCMLGALALPFLAPGKVRLALALLVIGVPIGFAADLWFWQQRAVTDLDPHAPLNMIANRVQSKLVGAYAVAQFKVEAHFASGFWHAVIAAANALGFLVAERRASLKLPGSVVALGAALLFTGATPASAATLEVGPGAPYPTISEAVAAAAPGDEVLVRAGTYRERVVIDRQIVLRGLPGAVIDAGGQGTVVLVRAPGTAVRGLAVRGSGESLLDEDAGIKVLEAADCAVEGNVVTDALFGILVRTSARVRIARNHVVGKDLELPRRADGIRIQDAHGSTIDDNVVEDSRDLAIWNANGCTARRNTVRRSRYGLHYMYCDDNVFEDNVFEDNHTGAAIMYSRHLVLRRNRFTGSRGPSAHGLLLKVADDVVAEGNWFVDNTRGIFLEDTPSSRRSGCTFTANVIGGNEVGVAVQPSVSRVVFAANALIANRVQVEVLGRARGDLNVWSVAGRGNYWSDYIGFDADGDGVGDTEHRVEQFFESLTEKWPDLAILRMSPAVEALEAAARAFPVVKPRPAATDARPLVAPPAALGHAPGSAARPGLALAGAVALAGASAAVARARRGEGDPS